MTRAVLLLAVAALVPSCPPPTPTPPPDHYVPGPTEGGVECMQPGPADDCQAAGLNLCHLACRSNGTPLWITPKGTPYAEACRRAKADGRDTMANGSSRARCLSNIAVCSMVEECR